MYIANAPLYNIAFFSNFLLLPWEINVDGMSHEVGGAVSDE